MPDSYTTTAAAKLADCGAQTLRGSLAAGLGLLTDPVRQVHEWATLEPIDVVRVAALRALQEWGLALHEGIGALAGSLDRWLIAHVTTKRDWPALLGVLRGVTLHVTRTPSRIDAGVYFPDSAARYGNATATLVLDIYEIARLCHARRCLIAPAASHTLPAPAGSESGFEGRRGGQYPSKSGSANTFKGNQQ